MKFGLDAVENLGAQLAKAGAQASERVTVGDAGQCPPTSTVDGGYKSVLLGAPAASPMPGGVDATDANNGIEVGLLGASRTIVNGLEFAITGQNGETRIRRNRFNSNAGFAWDIRGDYSFLRLRMAAKLFTPTSCPISEDAAPQGSCFQPSADWTNGDHGLFDRRLDAPPAIPRVWTLTVYGRAVNDVSARTDWDCASAIHSRISRDPAVRRLRTKCRPRRRLQSARHGHELRRAARDGSSGRRGRH